jgi:tetratricopeptide (TPR) repeat protein
MDFASARADVDARKRAGNAAYDAELYMEATREYDAAIEACEACLKNATHDDDDDFDATGVRRTLCAVRCNRAAAKTKRKMFEEAMEDAKYVIDRPLEAGPKVLCKAFYRLSKALEGVGDAEGAESALLSAKKIEPNNPVVKQALRNLSSVFHLIVVLNRATPEVLSRQQKYCDFEGHCGTHRRNPLCDD